AEAHRAFVAVAQQELLVAGEAGGDARSRGRDERQEGRLHEDDTYRHRDDGADEQGPAVAERGQGEPDHRDTELAEEWGSSIRARRAATSRAEGLETRSTTRPSVRNMTSSALAAASGSWVTITMVCP